MKEFMEAHKGERHTAIEWASMLVDAGLAHNLTQGIFLLAAWLRR